MKTKQMITEEWSAVRGLRVIFKNSSATEYWLPNDGMLKVDNAHHHSMYASNWSDWWRLVAYGGDEVMQFMKEVTTKEELVARCEAALAIEKALEDRHDN